MNPRMEGQYSFPRATVTNCHKHVGLRQQKCLLSQFWRLESKSSFTGLKPRCQQVHAPSGGSRGKICFLTFPCSGGSWLGVPSCILKASNVASSISLSALFSSA